MYLIRSALWVLLVMCLAGCGTAAPEPSATSKEFRFETKNLTTQKASLKKMTEGMTDEKKKEFLDCMTTVAQRGHSKTKYVDPSGEEFMKPLRGMTRSEIEARAKEIREQERAAQEKSSQTTNTTEE